MGQTITQQNCIKEIEPDTFLLKYLPMFQNCKIISKSLEIFYISLDNSLLVKTVLALNETEKEPIIIKLFSKFLLNDKSMEFYAKQLRSLKDIETLITPLQCPNIAPIIQIYDMETAGVLIRQYFSYNLRERLSSEPYISEIEKKWICFQLLYAVTQLHNKGICHGDIKLDNVLLTSLNSVFLSDVAFYKPTKIRIDDMRTYTYFFANKPDSKSCYLAPERLVEESLDNISSSNNDLRPEMDVFSLGVLIAEIFLEDVFIDYSKLVDLKKGNLNLQKKLKDIDNHKLVQLLIKMMDPDPKQRITLPNALDVFVSNICPLAISRMLVHFNTIIISHNYSKSDLLIALIYRHWKQIWKCLFDNEDAPEINHQLSPNTLNKLIKSTPITKIFLENFPLIFSIQCSTNLNLTSISSIALSVNNNSQCSIIIINYIIQSLLNLKYHANMVVAIDLLEKISLKSTDIIKIDLIIPYLVKCLDKKYGNLIQIKAFRSIITLLSSINHGKLVLKSIDYKFFNYYFFEQIKKIYYQGDILLKTIFVSYLENLIELEQKFLFSEMNSKYQFFFPESEFKGEMTESMSVLAIRAAKHPENVPLQKPSEMLRDYETDLNYFKGMLIDIINDIITNSNSYEVELVLIRQIPNLMVFYGNKEILYFLKVLLDVFSQGHYLLQQEIIKLFPKIFLITKDDSISHYFYVIIESIISRNANEAILHEMIHVIYILIKLEFIQSNKVIELFQKIFVYIMHPNILIREEIVNLACFLIQVTSQTDLYIYLWKEIKQCYNAPFISITSELFKSCLKKRISRNLYLIVDGGYDYNVTINSYEREILNKITRKVYNGLIHSNSNPNNNSSHSNLTTTFIDKNAQLTAACRANEQNFATFQREIMMKAIQKEIDIHNYTQREDIKCVQEKILSKLLIACNCNNDPIPKFTSIESIDFNNKTNNFYSSDCFQLKYLMKVLNITFEPNMFKRNITSNILKASINPSSSMSMFTKGQMKWKPKKQLVSTIYPEDNTQASLPAINKLLPFEDKTFLSFDSHNHVSSWSIESTEWAIKVEMLSSLDLSTDYSLRNKALICGNTKDEFIIGLNKSIEVYQLDTYKGDFIKTASIPNASTSPITCLDYLDTKQTKIISVASNGLISLYDIRMKNCALKYSYNTDKGIIRSMTSIDQYDHRILMGTSSGYLLNYDIRFNYVTDVYQYSNDTNNNNQSNSITNLLHFIPDERTELYDLYSLNLSKNNRYGYIFISTNSPDHDIGLWNMNTFNCDLLLKTNKQYSSEIKNTEIELPIIIKRNNNIYYQGDSKEALQQYLNKIISNKTFNKCSVIDFEEDYLKNISFGNIGHYYTNNNMIHCAINPYITDSNSNLSFILTGGNDRTIRYWEFSKESMKTANNENCTILAKTNEIENAFFITSSPDSTTIIQSNEIWNLHNNHEETTIEVSHELSISDMIYLREGPYVVSGGLDGMIKVWK